MEQLRERAVVLRIEVLHEHEAHARIERQVFEQLRERFQSAGRGADADNREWLACPWLVRWADGIVRRGRKR